MRDPLETETCPQSGHGSARVRRKRQVGRREMSAYLATREEPRAHGELRSSRLRSHIRRWTSPAASPLPPADAVPRGPLWGSCDMGRGPPWRPDSDQHECPSGKLMERCVVARCGQDAEQLSQKQGASRGCRWGHQTDMLRIKGCDRSHEKVLAGRGLCHCHQEPLDWIQNQETRTCST